MARLSLAPVLWGHWKGLSQRTYQGEVLEQVKPDYLSRVLSIALPLAAGVVVVLVPAKKGLSAEIVAGLALTWAALVSAGLIGVFTVLAGWRARLGDRAKSDEYFRAREKPVVALVDEAVAHNLMGVLDALLMAVFAAAAAGLPSPWSRWLLALAALFATHTAVLFIVISTRLYSAYVQVEAVATVVNGFDGPDLGLTPRK